MAQSLYIALRAMYPQVKVDVVAPAWSSPLLVRMPEINRVFSLNVAHGELGLGKRKQLANELRVEGYSHAIVLPRSFKSALVPWLAKIPTRIGDLGEFRYGLLNKVYPTNSDKKIPNACNYLRYFDLDVDTQIVKGNYQPRLNVDLGAQKTLLAKYGLSVDEPIVACMPGAEYGPSKQWPAEYFSKVLDACARSGWQACVFGSKKDSLVANEIEQQCSSAIYNLCGKTTLPEVIDLIAACRVAVSNDSGLMHIAAAVDVPTVSMYGATTPTYTPALHSRAKSFYMHLGCSPCWQRTCKYDHYRCLRDIQPEDVVAKLSKLIDYKK